MDDAQQIKVLVIDDSAYNRRAVSGFLDEVEGVTVVGKAADGQEGLQLALTEQPDVITTSSGPMLQPAATARRAICTRSASHPGT